MATFLRYSKTIFCWFRSDLFSRSTYRITLFLLGGLILFFIVLLKSKSGANFFLDPILLIYTVAITTFELSRIIGALLYPASQRNIVPKENSERYEPTVSFVIPCKNEEQVIGRTVEKCFAVDYPKQKLEVIVINDGSDDNTLRELYESKKRFPELQIVDWAENRGKRHGMANGFWLASGEIVVQLDSDSFIDPKTFRNLIRPFQNPRIGAVSAHTDPENADENLITKMQAAYYFISFRLLKAAESTFLCVFCCSGCASAYRRSVVLPIVSDWLGERFLGLPVTWGDDRALTNWVLRRDFKTIYTDSVRAYTIVPNSLRRFLVQQVRWKKGWFVNSVIAGRFIWRRDPFVAFTYFFPLVVVTLLAPLMAMRAFVYDPIVKGITPISYMLGVLLIACLLVVYYRWVGKQNKYWGYVFVWAILNMLVLSFVLWYALIRLQDRRWGTR